MQDDNFDLPSARKTPSGNPPSPPLNPGGSPWSAPLSPDHTPGTGPYDPSGGWGYDPNSTPYGAPIPGYVPPPPPGRGRPTATGGGNNRRGGIILLIIFGGILAVLGVVLLVGHLFTGDTSTPPTGPGPVAVATDKPTPTATLKPGQTPLPTRVPTSTPIPRPTALPGQPTFTPVPTATPIPYAKNASVSFTASTQKAPSVTSTVIASTSGGDISATVESASNVAASADEPQDQHAATPATYALTVHNNANTQQTSSGAVIHSTGGIACTLSGFVTVAAHSNATTTQDCTTAPGAQPANVSFNDSTSNSPFTYTGGPFPAGGSDEYYQVPADCATNSQDVADAQSADATKIDQALASQVPGGSAAPFYKAANTYSSLTCAPVAGTKEVTSTPQTFTVSLTGSGSQTTYIPSQATALQLSRLQNGVNHLNPAGSWQLINPSVCSAPSVSSHTATSATLSCPTSGTAQWIWSYNASTSNNQLNTLANLINGEPHSAAVSALKSVQGIVASTVSISLSGGTYVPQNTASIHFSVH